MSKTVEKEYKLKKGSCIIREIRKEDAEKTVEYLRQVVGETDFLLRYPEEVDFTVEQEEKILENSITSPDSLMLVALDKDRIIGVANVGRRNLIKTKHRASLGISILEEYWGRGIGTHFFEIMEEFAKKIGCVRIELGVIEGNERAMRLYEKRGFKRFAEYKDGIRLKDGTSLCEYIMAKELI